MVRRFEEEAAANGEKVTKSHFNRPTGKATNGDIPGLKRPDGIVESVDTQGGKVVRLGEVVSPASGQTVANQAAKLDGIAAGARPGVTVHTRAFEFVKGSGRLLGMFSLGYVAFELSFGQDYGMDDAIADLTGSGNAY